MTQQDVEDQYRRTWGAAPGTCTVEQDVSGIGAVIAQPTMVEHEHWLAHSKCKVDLGSTRKRPR